MTLLGTISPRSRSRLRVVVALALLAAIIFVVAALRPPVASPQVGWATALEACQAPTSAEKAGQTLMFEWHVAVEEDRPDASAMLFVSGNDEMLCLVGRETDGRYTNARSGLGRITPQNQATLTLDTGMAAGSHPAGASSANPAINLVAGRIPGATKSVLVTAADGVTQLATINNGRYIGWLTTDAPLIRIAALDVGGHEISALADPNGLLAK